MYYVNYYQLYNNSRGSLKAAIFGKLWLCYGLCDIKPDSRRWSATAEHISNRDNETKLSYFIRKRIHILLGQLSLTKNGTTKNGRFYYRVHIDFYVDSIQPTYRFSFKRHKSNRRRGRELQSNQVSREHKHTQLIRQPAATENTKRQLFHIRRRANSI